MKSNLKILLSAIVISLSNVTVKATLVTVEQGVVQYTVDTETKTAQAVGLIPSAQFGAVSGLTIIDFVTYRSESIPVTSVADDAFSRATNLSGPITLGRNIQTIGHHSFYHCTNLKGSLVIPNSVVSIGDFAFMDCWGLTETLTLGNSVSYIGAYAFEYCLFSGELKIPNSVKTIGEAAFDWCTKFTGSLIIPDSVEVIGRYAFDTCTGLNGELKISNSVREIADYAFNNCSGLKGALIIPDGVKSIGSYAFQDCTGFNYTLTIGKGMETIGSYAFKGCKGFSGSLIIPDSVVSIGLGAFQNCSGFNGTLTLSKYVESIESYTFDGCSGFIGSLLIPDSVKTIKNYAFRDCKSFDGDLILSQSLESIGDYSFYYCEKLSGVLTIPDSVTSIGDFAFFMGMGFTELYIGENLKTMGGSVGAAFFCNRLEEITCNAIVPPVAYTTNFMPSSYSKPLYVPKQSVAAYKSATDWKDFKSINPITVPASDIKIEYEGSLELNVNETLQLKAILTPENTTNTAVKWKTSSAGIVTVSSNGLATAVAPGDAFITVYVTNQPEIKDEVMITVLPIAAKSISIDGGGVESIKCTETLQLSATVLPSDTSFPEVTWETSSATTATVSPTGMVTGHNPGNVTITAYVTKYPDVRSSYQIEVSALLLGDSNDNGLVNVADVVTTANYIIDLPMASWSFINADVTNDKDITIADVTGTVDIILNDVSDANARLAMKAKASQLPEDLLVSGNFRKGEPEARIDVKLESSVPYSALQSSIILPEGMKVNDILAGSRLSDHILMFNAPKKGIVKVVIFSLYNTEFNKTDEPLFTIIADTGNASGDLQMLDIFGSDSESNEYELGFLGGINESYTTGMETLNSDKVIVRGIAGGIEVINADGRAVSVFRHTGETVASIPYASSNEKINLLPGIYIVKAGGDIAKVFVK